VILLCLYLWQWNEVLRYQYKEWNNASLSGQQIIRERNREPVWTDFFNTVHHSEDKHKIKSSVLYDRNPVIQKQIRTAEKKDSYSVVLPWKISCQISWTYNYTKANHIMACLEIKNVLIHIKSLVSTKGPAAMLCSELACNMVYVWNDSTSCIANNGWDLA
jgi:hypothetical protein